MRQGRFSRQTPLIPARRLSQRVDGCGGGHAAASAVSRRRGCAREQACAYCALNCCSTTALAPSTSVAVTRRVSLPLACLSEICPSKEPALVWSRVTWRRDCPLLFRISRVIVAGSDTV